jgi:ParB-like chromosome segregation protein Spo0J
MTEVTTPTTETETETIIVENVTYSLPYAERWPKLGDDEFAELKASIAKYGVRQPILIDSASVVYDGHHRLRALAELTRETGATPYHTFFEVAELSADELVKLADEQNAARRHLTKAERAELILRLRDQGLSMRKIADKLGIVPQTVHNVLGRAAAEGKTTDAPSTITGRDGKTYTVAPPKPKEKKVVAPIEERAEALASQLAETLVEETAPETTEEEETLELVPWSERPEAARYLAIILDENATLGAKELASAYYGIGAGLTPKALIEKLEEDAIPTTDVRRLQDAYRLAKSENDGWLSQVWHADASIRYALDAIKKNEEAPTTVPISISLSDMAATGEALRSKLTAAQVAELAAVLLGSLRKK